MKFRKKKEKKPTKNNSKCKNRNNKNKQKQQGNNFYADAYLHLIKILKMCPLFSPLSNKMVSSSVAKLQMNIN